MCPPHTCVLPSAYMSSLLSMQVSFPRYMHPTFFSLWGSGADCTGIDPNGFTNHLLEDPEVQA